MDLKGSLVNTNLKIYPTEKLLNYLKLLKIDDSVPINIIKLLKGNNIDEEMKKTEVLQDKKTIPIYLNSKDIENLNKIKATVKVEEEKVIDLDEICKLANTERDAKSAGDSKDVKDTSAKETTAKDKCKGDFIDTFKLDDSNKITKNTEVNEKKENTNDTKKSKEYCNESIKNESSKKEESLLLTTTDIDWLYGHLQKLRTNGEKSVPYLHELLEGVQIATPDNIVIKRNPVLEARCVKLRAQQEAREYRKMTKSVDNVRMRFPEDSISYQLKQVNRQLIAIGQFIISIFAGFLFGFKGVEWMIGQLDFGFRLLLGVMCALIIALAEIYFLAKKLNEELNVPETIQLGGPPKFVDQQNHFIPKVAKKESVKEHED